MADHAITMLPTNSVSNVQDDNFLTDIDFWTGGTDGTDVSAVGQTRAQIRKLAQTIMSSKMVPTLTQFCQASASRLIRELEEMQANLNASDPPMLLKIVSTKRILKEFLGAASIFARATCPMDGQFIAGFTSLRPFMGLLHHLVCEYRRMLTSGGATASRNVEDLIRQLSQEADKIRAIPAFSIACHLTIALDKANVAERTPLQKEFYITPRVETILAKIAIKTSIENFDPNKIIFTIRCYDKMRNVHVKSMQTWIFGRSRNFQINRSFGVDRPASEVKVGVKVDPRKLATFGTKSCVGRWTVRIGGKEFHIGLSHATCRWRVSQVAK